MNNTHTRYKIVLALLLSAAGTAGLSTAVYAQDGGGAPAAPPAPAQTQQKPVTLDLRDAPVRAALEQLFSKIKADYVIDPAVSGYVTLRITDKPFEDALRLLLRAGTMPLTYTRDNGVYIVKPRRVASAAEAALGPAGPPSDPTFVDSGTVDLSGGRRMESIQLVYIDPYDLKDILGITIIPVGSRPHNLGGGAGAPAGAPGAGAPRGGVPGGGGGLVSPGGGNGLIGGGGGRLLGQ